MRRHRQKIARVYLAITETDDGEDVYTLHGPDGQLLPLVAIDDKDLVSLRQHAKLMSRKTRKPVRIISFTKRSHHEIFPESTTGDNE